MFHRDVALHILDDHDGIVHNQSCGERDAEKRERVDREIEEADEGKCADERDRDGDRRNDGGAPVEQEEEDDCDDDDNGFGQGDQDLADRVSNYSCRIECHGVFEAWGEALG